MKIKKKGFTLVELLATILVLGVVLSITIYVVYSSLARTKNGTYEVTIKNIERSASAYLQENSDRLFFVTDSLKTLEYQCVTVQNLIDYGYLDGNVTDSKISENKTANKADYIYVERNIKTKAIDKTIYVDDANNEYADTCEVAVRALGDIALISEPSLIEWSRSKNIRITYRLKNINDVNTLNKYKYLYNYAVSDAIVDNGSVVPDNLGAISRIVTVNKDGKVSAEITLGSDKIASESLDVGKIDRVGPVVSLGNYTGSKNIRHSVTIPLKLTDYGIGTDYSTFTKDDIKVFVGSNEVTNIELSQLKDNDENYNLVINNDLLNGKIIIKIVKDMIFDKLNNGNEDINIDTDITFDNTYKITYNANGGKNAPDVTTYQYAPSGTINLSSVEPTRDGYAFKGWSTNSDATVATYTAGAAYQKNVTNDITLYAVWSVMQWIFEYTGYVQTFTVPYTGRYKLEVWGAQGGSDNYGTGGKGGYSVGYVNLSANNNIYVVVGGAGTTSSGGYNGGGIPANGGGGGGGATHIAKLSGVLKSLSNNKDKVLIVAGGGGGASKDVVSSDVYDDGGNYFAGSHDGGAGGGVTGGAGFGNTSQSAGGKSDNCPSTNFFSYRVSGTFGSGGNNYCCCGCGGEHMAGGGGGWCGGDGGDHLRSNSGGGGGSGYINGVSNGSTNSGVREGNGRAIITFS